MSAETAALIRLDIPFRLPAHNHHRPGTSVESQLFHSLAKLCGIRLSCTTAYHPAANGLVERFHWTLKAAIMCYTDQHWTEALPLVLLGIRTSYKMDLHASVAELVHSELLAPSAQHHRTHPT
jgi:transposase InsO family protein